MTTEYLNEKAETCRGDTIQTLVSTLRKLQEGLYAMNWIKSDIVPADWHVDGAHQPRGPFAPDEARSIKDWVNRRDAEYGQALGFILASGARIDETLHLRADKVFVTERRAGMVGEGGAVGHIQKLAGDVALAVGVLHRVSYFDYKPAQRC